MELPSPEQFVVALALGAGAAMLVFAHAERHGNRRATAWGVLNFLFFPFALIAYFAVQRWRRRR